MPIKRQIPQCLSRRTLITKFKTELRWKISSEPKLKGTSERITLYEIKSVIGESLVAKKHDALVKDGIKWTRAGASKDLSEENTVVFELDGDDVLLFRFKGDVRAVLNT